MGQNSVAGAIASEHPGDLSVLVCQQAVTHGPRLSGCLESTYVYALRQSHLLEHQRPSVESVNGWYHHPRYQFQMGLRTRQRLVPLSDHLHPMDLRMQHVSPSFTHDAANRVINGVVTSRVANGHRHGRPAVRAILLLANMLDCEALAGLFRRREGVEVLEASADVDHGLSRCGQLFPDILIVDPGVALDVISRATEMVRLMQIRHLVVLEDRVHEGRLASLLSIPSVSYFTRQAGFEALYSATKRMATDGTRVFEPSVARRIVPTARGLRLRPLGDRPSIVTLTSREVEVMGLLAGGRSVRECAEHLRLAQSTIDNHKARLMKKLEIHKVAELTQVAIREGLISV